MNKGPGMGFQFSSEIFIIIACYWENLSFTSSVGGWEEIVYTSHSPVTGRRCKATPRYTHNGNTRCVNIRASTLPQVLKISSMLDPFKKGNTEQHIHCLHQIIVIFLGQRICEISQFQWNKIEHIWRHWALCHIHHLAEVSAIYTCRDIQLIVVSGIISENYTQYNYFFMQDIFAGM